MMTEQDILGLSVELNIDENYDVEIERAWVLKNIEEARQAETRSVAAFRMWRFLRDDAGMRRSESELRTTRNALVYLRRRLDELGGQV
jgi:hypothetical protein